MTVRVSLICPVKKKSPGLTSPTPDENSAGMYNAQFEALKRPKNMNS